MLDKARNLIRNLKYNTHPAKMESRARKAVMFGTGKAFEFFKDENFHTLIDFKGQSQEEQDRIFNELTVTNLIFLLLVIEQKVDEADNKDEKEYYRTLASVVPEYFKNYIRSINVPEEFAVIWDKLIELRHSEYSKDMRDFREEFLNQDDDQLRELAFHKSVIIFQVIALGLYDHLVRGKIEKDSPLYKYIQAYLFGLYKGYNARI